MNRDEGSNGSENEGAVIGALSRREALAGLGGAAAVSGLTALPAADAAVTRAGEVVGAPKTGRTAMEFVGRIDQTGGEFVAYGFFTLLHGLRRGLLFSAIDDPLSEAAARFTFHATATLKQRSIIDERVFVLDVNGSLEHYFQSAPSATFADPESFKNGTRIARSSIRFQTALSTIAENEGIPTLEGPMIQKTEAGKFTLDGKRRTFGRMGLRTHVFATGRATREEETAPIVALSIAGNAIVLG